MVPNPAAATVTEAPIEILPEHIEPFLVSPDGWHRIDDSEFATGPIDLGRAASDEAGEGGNVDEARHYLEQLGFIAGYSRAWDRLVDRAPGAKVTLYLFGTVEAADVYAENSLAELESLTDPAEWEAMTVGDVPGARGFTGGNAYEGYASLVAFATDGLFVGVSCENWTGGLENRRCAETLTRLQYHHIVELLKSL